MTENRNTLQVKELTRLIKSSLEGAFRGVYVEGEISNFKRTTAGHVYFTLKDDASQISCVMFRFQASKYLGRQDFSGVKVRVLGDVSVYERSGNYQIICSALEKVGLGELQLKFLKLKESLYKKGWFAEERKVPLPFLPKRVAIVTSRTGAAVRDMLNIIYQRFPEMDVLLYPVKVQGEGSAEEIARAIDHINEENMAPVMIVGRGGGSLEDLWAFNELCVAEAIFRSAIPVISAVGHEVDFSISDFVADRRAETPSAAAQMVVPSFSDLREVVYRLKSDLTTSARSAIEGGKASVLNFKNHYCFKDAFYQVRHFQQRLDDLSEDLCRTMRDSVASSREHLGHQKKLLESFSPFGVLDRGYAILKDDSGRVIRSVNDVEEDDLFFATLGDGDFRGRVHKTYKDSPS